MSFSGELGKSFEPSQFEDRVYRFWEENGYFEAKDTNAPGQEMFCVMIPPPNVTGVLHMGHALTDTLQDILVRWHRMKGDNSLWMPGTDHAGIATQVQVEKKLSKQGKTRHQLGREAFLEETWKWKEEHGSQISKQMRRMGCSLDWKRERFTMDPGFSNAVKEVFVRLYEEGLIYRGERIINWCPVTNTALSDLEVIPTERKGHLWHIAYKIVEKDGTPVRTADGSPAQLVVATTRPETLLGDTAVAIHPDDERYTAFQGKMAVLPLLGRLIPIITDTYVEKDFGTGALKVTPAHDFNDYELGKRHSLPMISVMGLDGKITAHGGPYAGMKFKPARAKVVEDLTAAGLLLKVEDHVHKVGMSQRADVEAEPVVSKQWFVKIEPLAKPAIAAVETGKVTFTPKSWEKTYFEWMYNIRDWCISRQLWWGHQIPAWHCAKCEAVTVSRTEAAKCSSCGAGKESLTQDPDVLDTWFSSALWPFATLGWPEKTPALQTFYPNSVLETGFDIIFFWVARMMMMGIHFMGDVPFKKIYLHAMVRDEKGEKMSKSKGNVIDPLDLIDKHGADPLRLTLAAMAGQGRDIKLSVDRVEGYRGFCNKLWNAVKFFHFQTEAERGGALTPVPGGDLTAWIEKNRAQFSPVNRWILSRFQKTAETVDKGFAAFEIDESTRAVYEFTWYELCDWFIEFTKQACRQGGPAREESLRVLHYVLEQTLTLAHPIIPFVTEELWHALPLRQKGETLMKTRFPAARKAWIDEAAEAEITAIRNVVEAIRNFRGENGIPPKKEIPVVSYAPLAIWTEASRSRAAVSGAFNSTLVNALEWKTLEYGTAQSPTETSIPLTSLGIELRIDLRGLVNTDEELKRVLKEIQTVQKDLEFVRGKLSKESFVQKAPPALIEKERAREQEFLKRLQELEATQARLGRLG